MSLMDAPYVWETAPKCAGLVGGGEREKAFPHGKLQTQKHSSSKQQIPAAAASNNLLSVLPVSCEQQ